MRDLTYKQAFLATTVVPVNTRNAANAAFNVREDELTSDQVAADMTLEERKVRLNNETGLPICKPLICGMFLRR